MEEYTYKKAIGKECVGKSDFAYRLDTEFSKMSYEEVVAVIGYDKKAFEYAHTKTRLGCSIRTGDKILFQELFNRYYETGEILS